MICPEVGRYLESTKGLPFLYAVGDVAYTDILTELKQVGLKVIRVSDFCFKEDRFPDYDSLIEHFRTLDIDYKDNRFVVVGLGESLALKGSEEAKKILRRVKSVTLGNARVVVLLRGVAACLRDILTEDPRLVAKKLGYIDEDCATSVLITNNRVIENKKCVGIKGVIYELEDGATGNINTTLSIDLPNSLLPIKTIDNAYEALTKAFTKLKVSEKYGTNEQWMRLLDMYHQKPNEVQQYFSEYKNNENEIYEHIVGDAYRIWMYFVNLKMYCNQIQNSYLQYVIYDTNDAGELKDKILIDIIGIPHTDKRFKEYYQNRKRLLKSFPESELAYFVSENQVDPAGEIYNYTDTTVLEKRQIVNWISNNGWNDMISELYPQLGLYMKKYIFACGSISDQLTEYFELYKHQKIQNRIEDNFLKLVDEYGKKYLYTKLPTRDSAINKIENKQATYLYWIDALGVEYLSYIIGMANKRGLSVKVDITRADLPTITSINKSFYENWPGDLKYKEEDLDNTKHKEKGGFFYTQDKTPVHIIRELEIIEKAIDAAVSSLALHKCKQFVIASDHGASRLAVIKEKENPHQTDTKGEHSGRCCKAYDEDNREYIVEENGYFVRTDYERYAGSRAANVEVHGGATLEEIIVPVITLSLKCNTDVDIRLLNAEKITADRHDGTYIEVYISYVEQKENVIIVIDGNKYKAIAKDGKHFAVWLSDIKRQKKCVAELFDGADLIGSINLDIKGKTATVNSDFDDMF